MSESDRRAGRIVRVLLALALGVTFFAHVGAPEPRAPYATEDGR